MNNKYYGIDINDLENQEFKNSVINYASNHNINFDQDFFTTITTSNKKTIDNFIKELTYNADLFIDSLSALGHSTFSILTQIIKLRKNNINLHILDKKITLDLKNNLPFEVILSILEIENLKIKNRIDKAKNTIEQKNIEVGRKSGRPTKSMFDEHKRKIKHLHNQGVPNTKIVEIIGVGNSQALGKYIKKLKKIEKDKQIKKGTYLHTKDDLKNIDKFNN